MSDAALATVKRLAQIGEVAAHLDGLTAVRGELVRPHPSGKLICVACAHRCKLADGARGLCLVRRRLGSSLAVPWGYTAGVAVDPIEKKPFFHFLPGARALSFGMLGCDLHCPYCQNWFSSQTLRDPGAGNHAVPVEPRTLIEAAVERGCRVISATYNEPLITSEWSHDIFALARPAGLRTTYVSNGHATSEVLDYLGPLLDGCKVDLKAFSDATYRTLGGRLQPVLDTIAALAQRGVWVEVVTLVVPGLNDSAAELGEIAAFIASVSVEIPWHVTAFHPDYQMTERPRTSAAALLRAAEIGAAAGLRFVYAGNLPGHTGDLEDTRCPQCKTTLIRRRGFAALDSRLGLDGHCPECRTVIPGRWA